MLSPHAFSDSCKIWQSLLLAVFVVLLSSPAWGIEYPFSDDMENTTSGNWAFDPPWGYTTASAHSGSHSICDSPGGTYENGVNVKATLASGINLTTAQMPVLRFWERYALEANADFGYVEVSVNGGSTWSTIYFVTGTASELAGGADRPLRLRLADGCTGAVPVADEQLADVTTAGTSTTCGSRKRRRLY